MGRRASFPSEQAGRVMSDLSEQDFIVLNGVHLKKMATVEDVANAVGLDVLAVGSVLATAANAGLVMALDGKHLLLPEGTSAVHEYYGTAYDALRSDEAVLAWYRRFEATNRQFIRLVSEWQSSSGDERVEARVIGVVERLIKNLQEIIPLVRRYENYVKRLEASIVRIDDGDKGFVCNPTVDSVHNIWFEFHEDILTVIGRPRDT